MNAQVSKANKETEEQKAIVNKLSLDNSLLIADKVLLEGQLDNALMVIDTKDKEIINLNNEINLLERAKENKKIDKTAAKFLVRKLTKKYNTGTSIDELADMLIEFLEK